jgi:hypothetical protein
LAMSFLGPPPLAGKIYSLFFLEIDSNNSRIFLFNGTF